MTLRSSLWSDLTRNEIAAARDMDALVVIPTGAVEQHASHLPVGTDMMAVGHLTLAAARRAKVPVLVLPTMQVTFSPHHRSWPGTLSLRLETFNAVLADITASVAHAGFRRQLVINGHGGNRGPLIALTTELITGGREVGYADYWGLAHEAIAGLLKGGRDKVGHACEMETALVLALTKGDAAMQELILKEASGLPPLLDTPAARGDTGSIGRGEAWWPPIFGADHPGYEGDPAAATAETGAALVDAIGARLADYYAEFMALDLRSGAQPATSPFPPR
jgi:creatinine amidohydrolase